MSAAVIFRTDWNCSRDDEGHRIYSYTNLVKTTSFNDGPYIVLNATGLAVPGTLWQFGNDNDAYAFCYPSAVVRLYQHKQGHKHKYWTVEQKFGTKPLKRCQTDSIESPLSEPQGISGSFIKYTKETQVDRLGKLIKSSSHEIIARERDANRPTVIISQNVATLGLDTFSAMVDTVNDASLWGLDERCVKLDNVSWERKLYGTCTYYYTRRFEFSVNYETFDDSKIADAGYKVLKGAWTGPANAPVWTPVAGLNANNPLHFVNFSDPVGNATPKQIPLDGAGKPNTDLANPVFLPTREYYNESNFLTLGIPSSL